MGEKGSELPNDDLNDEGFDFSTWESLNEEQKIEIEKEINDATADESTTIFDISVNYNTFNLSTLLKMWNKGRLVVPEFQRSFVWQKRRASEFIDSILRGLPVPSIFLYEDTVRGEYLVVDGRQRITALNKYINEGKWQQINGEVDFKLIGSIHPKWARKTFVELEEDEQDRLVDALINVTLVRPMNPADGQKSMYLAFQRVNTGGVTLNAQEIRMAVSYGPLANLLDELAQDKRFESWSFLRTDQQRINQNYSNIQELILKFWVYYLTYPKLKGSSTRTMCDQFFSDQRDFEEPINRRAIVYFSENTLRESFESVLDDLAILSSSDLSPEEKPAQTYLEAIWVGLAHRKMKLKMDIKREEIPNIVNQWKSSIGEEKFSELFQARRSSSAQSVNERIKAAIEYFSKEF